MVSPGASGEKWWKRSPLSLPKQCWPLFCALAKEGEESFQARAFSGRRIVLVCVL